MSLRLSVSRRAIMLSRDSVAVVEGVDDLAVSWAPVLRLARMASRSRSM